MNDAQDNKQGRDKKGSEMKMAPSGTGNTEPEWAAGLKRLYNSVLEEPMPDNFKDLLSKLDNDHN